MIIVKTATDLLKSGLCAVSHVSTVSILQIHCYRTEDELHSYCAEIANILGREIKTFSLILVLIISLNDHYISESSLKHCRNKNGC